VADTARGLHYAHTACDDDGRPLGVVHRDVTPHNLFVCADGRTKVLDFGIAKAASQLHQTRAGTLKGKFAYLAPEQIRGQPIDKRVDVFALGIVLHELLTLKPLFRGRNDGETLQRVLELEVPPPEKVRAGVPPVGAALGSRGCGLRALHAPSVPAAVIAAPRELDAPPARIDPAPAPQPQGAPAVAAAPREATLKIDIAAPATFVVDGHA